MNEKNYTDSTSYEMLPIVEIRRKNGHYWNPEREQYDEKKHIMSLGSSVVIDVKIKVDNDDKWIEIPLCLGLGCNYEFYNQQKAVREWRKITTTDIKDAWDRATKCFPAWVEWAENYAHGDDLASALKWFNDPSLYASAVVNVAITTRTYADGTVKKFAKICSQGSKLQVCSDDEMAQINKALKAAGVKLFGGAKKPTKPTAAPVAAPKKPTPPTPKKSIEKLMDDAFTAYQEAHPEDDTGAKYYDTIADILKKPKETWESWTVDEWEQIIRDLTIPF